MSGTEENSTYLTTFHTVAAYKMDYDQLRKAAERYPPLLVHYEKPEGHFALVLAADEDGPVVADPASGTGALDRGAFMERWSGYVLLAALPGRSPRKDGLAKSLSVLDEAASLSLSFSHSFRLKGASHE